jgi:glucose-1-phosphate cytidylyltransferase
MNVNEAMDMKILILAGGFGTRISEESYLKPKPMIEIGEMPIIWHIMKLYSFYGFNDFVILAGYKQYIIKEYFNNYFLHHSDITFDMKNNTVQVHSKHSEPWTVTVVDTGLNTMTGGRIKRVKDYIQGEPFMLTYGDAVSNVNISELLKFHQKSKKLLTITAVNIAQTKGIIDIDSQGNIQAFREKDKNDSALINGGFMVCEPSVIDYIQDDSISFEKGPLNELVAEKQANAFVLNGFWQCMDTKRDHDALTDLWNSQKAPWKVWKD